MSMLRVLIADKMQPEGLQPLIRDPNIELIESFGLVGEALADALADVDAVVVRSSTRITRESLARADNLRVIGRAGVGVDNIDVDAATEKGIAVFNAPSGNTISAAELTMALLLAVVRRVPAAHASMRAGEWDRTSFAGSELYGKTLGLVGAGRIGGEVARRARAFGMTVIAYDPFLSETRARGLEIELVQDLDTVLSRSDVLSLHTPLTEQTAGLIGERELAMMKKNAVVLNAARGGVLDEAALASALADGTIAGAALDVYEEEPLPPEHPLRSAPNVVLTPHLGASTREAQLNVAVEIADVVRAALLEGDLSGAVNAPAVGGEEMRRLRPALDLAERLGTLAAGLNDAPVSVLEVRCAGYDDSALRPLAAAVAMGLLGVPLGRGAVNFVNALHLAEQRGIRVERVRLEADEEFGEYLEVRVHNGGGVLRVGGALLGQSHPRLVRIDGYRIDVQTRGTLLVLRNRDVPGVIGRVGTILGESGANIGEYHQARHLAGGEALAAISVDGMVQPSVIARLRKVPDVLEVRQAELG